MASRSRMPASEVDESMTEAEKLFLKIIVGVFVICILVIWGCPRCYADTPRHFTNAVWVFGWDTEHFLTANVNGTYHGRVALGTYYQLGVSYLVPDEIFRNGFSGVGQ